MPRAEAPVSVLMPVRNGQRTILAALRDLVTSMSADDELLVIDDGSNDGTAGVLREFSEREPRLRVIPTTGIGLVNALNLGLREVAHRWVARADADDRYPPDRLRAQRHAVEDGVVLVSGDYRITSAGRALGDIPGALTHPFVAASLVHPQRIPHPGVLLDRDAVLSVGGYKADDFPAEDLALWLRLSTAGRFVGVPQITVLWEMSSQSVTHSHQISQRRKAAEILNASLPSDVIRAINVESVQGELNTYRYARLEASRGVLLTRDLFALRARGVDGAAYRTGIAALPRHPLTSAWATGALAFDQVRRHWVRRGLTR